MSAMWAAMTAHKHPGLTVYQVAGDLLVDGHRVFGTDATEEEIARQLDRSNLDWDGHSWIAVGGFIGDLSVISTAHSTNAPPGLWTAIVRSFRDTNCLLCPGEDLKGAGLEYRPRYVVTKVQVDSLLLGADAAFELRRQQGRDRE